MSTSRVRTNRIRTMAATLLVAAVALAGCGGDDDGSDDNGGSTGGETTTEQTTPQDEGDGGGASSEEARSLFSNTCGGCHQLSDAGTSGTVGPNLDDTSMDAAQVAQKIEEGGGGMPPNLLEGEERDQVAEYVASAAGS